MATDLSSPQRRSDGGKADGARMIEWRMEKKGTGQNDKPLVAVLEGGRHSIQQAGLHNETSAVSPRALSPDTHQINGQCRSRYTRPSERALPLGFLTRGMGLFLNHATTPVCVSASVYR